MSPSQASETCASASSATSPCQQNIRSEITGCQGRHLVPKFFDRLIHTEAAAGVKEMIQTSELDN